MRATSPVLALVLSLLLAVSAHAQDRPVVYEGHIGHASFVDDDPIGRTVYGGSVRVYVTPRLAIGPEFTYMVGPGRERLWFLTGNATVDLIRARPVVPYLIAGGGMTHMTTEVGTGLNESGEGTFTGGGGVRVHAGKHWYAAPEYRLGWELHWRLGVTVGIR